MENERQQRKCLFGIGKERRIVFRRRGRKGTGIFRIESPVFQAGEKKRRFSLTAVICRFGTGQVKSIRCPCECQVGIKLLLSD